LAHRCARTDGGDGRRTRAETDVVQSQVGDAGVHLEEEGEGLANAASGAEDGDLGELHDDDDG